MWKPVSLPYTACHGVLPTTLPTVDEIRASTGVIYQRTGQTVVAVSPDVFVKYGQSTQEREGQTLLYLERYLPKIPAPRLYAMYYDSGDLFIVMQRLPGVRLDTIWGDLLDEGKALLTAELRTIFDDMRSAHCPWLSFFGSVGGGPVPHPLFFCDEPDPAISGPFQDEDSFNMGLVLQHKYLKDMNRAANFKGDFYARHLGKVLRNHKPTFTHSDVQRKNILVVDKSQKGQSQLRSYSVAVVDWEDAGWYPEYWEYSAMFVGFRWDDDWCARFEEFIPAWPAEAAMLKLINTDLFF